jgi:hypothetical protein
MEAFKRRFNRETKTFNSNGVKSFDSACDWKPVGAHRVRAWPYSYIMDLTGHPAPFPQLEILHLFPGLTAALSRCASVLPTWSLRKRSHHRHRRERNRSWRSTTSPLPPSSLSFLVSASSLPAHARPRRCPRRPW